MSEYSYKSLWEKGKIEDQERRETQVAKAEHDLTDGAAVIEGLNSGFWKIIKDQFIAVYLDEDLIDTCPDEALLALREKRRVLRELMKFLQQKAEAGNRAGRFLKTLKQKGD